MTARSTIMAALLLAVAAPFVAMAVPKLVACARRQGACLSVSALYVSALLPALAVISDPRYFHSRHPGRDMSSVARLFQQLGTAGFAVMSICALLVLYQTRLPTRGWLAALLGFVGLGVTSAALAGQMTIQVLLLPGLLLAVATCRRVTSAEIAKFARVAFRSLIIASLCLLVVSPEDAVWIGADEGRFFGVRQFAGLASHPNGMGLLAASWLVLELHDKASWRRHLYIILATLGLILAQSRSAWLGATVATAVWLSGRVGWPKTLLTLLPAGAAGWWLFSEEVNESGLSNRDKIWSIAWGIFRENPIIGGGPSALRDVVEGTDLAWGAQAHNQLLDALAKFGLIGAGLLIVFVVLVGQAVVSRARGGDTLPLALAGLLFVRSMFDASIGTNLPFLTLVAILASLPTASIVRHPSKETTPPKKRYESASKSRNQANDDHYGCRRSS